MARMTDRRGRATYPPAAYAPNAVLWWELQTHPGSRRAYGAELRISAWLAFHKGVGDVFTTKELRTALGEGDVPNDQEHFQRRIRELRTRDGWDIPSVKYDRNLEAENYRVDVVGWHPGRGTDRPAKSSISAKVKREVLSRDLHRCWSCGLGANEPNPDNGGRPTVLTAGHVRANANGGSADLGNLRAECSFCNETMRSESYEPPAPDVVMARVRGLDNENQRLLHQWITDGGLSGTPAFALFNTWRMMAPSDQQTVLSQLQRGRRR